MVAGRAKAICVRAHRMRWMENRQLEAGHGAVKFDRHPGQTILSQPLVATTTLGFPLFTRKPSLLWAVKFDRHPGQTTLSPFVGAPTTLGHSLIHPKIQPTIDGQI